jgi:hypothetical protein
MSNSRSIKKPPSAWERLCTACLGWLVPGLGYWLLGFRVRAVVLGTVVLGLFWYGEWTLADKLAVSRTVHPYFFVGQAGIGASAFVADELWGEPRPEAQIDRDLPVHLNLGILFTLIGGLLNVLLVLHCADPRAWEEARETAGITPEGGT